MCASVNSDEAYIFREVMPEWRDKVLGTSCNAPNSVSPQPQQSIMETAISTLVSQFKAYAGKDGSASTLSKDEFQNLVTSQLPNYVKNSGDAEAIDQLMGSLDENNDGELTFSEFWQLIGKLASKQGGFSQ
ncbi:protein S100-A13-like [Seriola dumerili]|uniref:Protein S100-A13-like n=1 Tax=Seriola dumerili TaxID=41447 RepID=A0A3B4V210_SERDU|nr:protein S100-A13-like [Seriola dumerili]